MIASIQEVIMPFASGFFDGEGEPGHDPRACFRGLAREVVRRPLSTFIVRSATAPGEGRARYLVVDRSVAPREGGIVLYATEYGLREGVFDSSMPASRVWGTVLWLLEQR
jgi:hypothetical protein